jgi:hypothetical protein
MSVLRRETKGGRKCLSICVNYRDESGEVHRRVLNNFGNVYNFTPEALEVISPQLNLVVKGPAPSKTQIKELTRHNYGFQLVAQRLL